ncbi:MAG TPA: tripartite tricarboxylate transporter TctB family protein, partial [Hyphomicrobiaceae bacterium]|nr:tripartite tricarboxylate transporter TctB family protein [Hyphomicrobiaceae bacterium]
NDTVNGLILIIGAIVMIALTLSFPPFPGQKYGPSLFPRILGGALILCGILLINRGVREGRPAIALAPWAHDPWRVVSFMLIIAAALIAIFSWSTVGFVPVTVVTLAGLFLWFRVHPVTALLTAILATVLLQIFFGRQMRIPLPLGWLLNLPPGWLKYIT